MQNSQTNKVIHSSLFVLHSSLFFVILPSGATRPGIEYKLPRRLPQKTGTAGKFLSPKQREELKNLFIKKGVFLK
jgi:hypothetical protein